MSKSTILQIAGKNIRAQRLVYGFTQKHVADEAGMSQSAFSKVESGQGDLKFEHAVRIARLLHCTMDELASPRMVIRMPAEKVRKAS